MHAICVYKCMCILDLYKLNDTMKHIHVVSSIIQNSSKKVILCHEEHVRDNMNAAQDLTWGCQSLGYDLYCTAGVTNLFTAECHIAIFSSHGGPNVHVFAVGGKCHVYYLKAERDHRFARSVKILLKITARLQKMALPLGRLQSK